LNGQLTNDVSFVITSAGKEYVGVLKASETTTANKFNGMNLSGNTSRTQLEAELQDAIDTAVGKGNITVGDNGSGVITLEGNSGLKFRGNNFQDAFVGPDNNNAFEVFNEFGSGFTFDNVMNGLQNVVGFLDGVVANAGTDIVTEALNNKLPLINKSIAQLVDMAASFSSLLQQLANNPATSLQALETLLENALGLPAGSNLLSYDPNATSGDALKFNFPLATKFNQSLPFNLDLSDPTLGLPAFLSNLVGVSPTGDLGVSLIANLALVLGIGLKGKDEGKVFLYTGGGGSAVVTTKTQGGATQNEVQVVTISAPAARSR